MEQNILHVLLTPKIRLWGRYLSMSQEKGDRKVKSTSKVTMK